MRGLRRMRWLRSAVNSAGTANSWKVERMDSAAFAANSEGGLKG